MNDVRTILEYFYFYELEDFAIEQRDKGIDLGSTKENRKAWEDLAAADRIHIFGAIVRVGRKQLNWK